MSKNEEKFEVKEERFKIVNDKIMDANGLISDVQSNFFLNDGRNCDIERKDVQVLSEKSFMENIMRKDITLTEVGKTSNDYVAGCSLSCNVCQIQCKNCKSICVSCRSACFKCLPHKNSSTDTDDFDKYLESLSRKVKPQPKLKTVGTDTCDLEGHFDYYKLEKKTVRIQKHVATDCADLNLRKPVVKKNNRNTVGVDTSDLTSSLLQNKEDDESDCEFFWTEKEETKTYSKKPNITKTILNEVKDYEEDISSNSLIIDEDSSLHPLFKEEDNKENFNQINDSKDVSFDNSSTSDESDIDLATSSKVSKCRQLAKKHNLKLKQVSNENGVSFKCSICLKTFQKKYVGVLHLGGHIESSLFKCLICSEKFKSLDFLYTHMKNVHSARLKNKKCDDKKMIEGENKENSGGNKIKAKTDRVFKCKLCPTNEESVNFGSSKALLMHKSEQHGIERVKTNEVETKMDRKPRVKREFICLICGKQFKSSKALKDHSPVHTGEKNYHCDTCNKSYTTSANLKIHKRTHTGARDFVCSVCGKAFHKKDSLKVHFRKHSGERPFQCDLCPMKFDRKYILKNHRFTHFSEKTFICPVCGKTFTTHGGLNNHEKSHKKDLAPKKPRKPAVKPTLDTENAVICDVCGKIYSTRNNLRIHKLIHLGVKPFECKICHQTYAKKDSMLIHMRTHTDERPFACETCGMTFYRNHTLKTHRLRHTGERPHKCKMCGKSFTQSSSLIYHLKNHDKKVEKKKMTTNDPGKPKKKRSSSTSPKSGVAKKVFKVLKADPDFQPEDVKVVFHGKKSPEEFLDGSKDSTLTNMTEKGNHYLLPVPEKEVVLLDKNIGVEFSRTTGKDVDLYSLEKDVSFGNQYNLNKFNYYIAKSQVFSVPRESVKSKTVPKEIDISIDKGDADVENLIISKTSYITKEGNLITLNRGSPLKDVKEEFVQIENERPELLKSQATIPISGEILNTTFISDENGEVIPLSSMTLQGLNTENIMISPFVPVEGDDRKGILRNSKFAVLDSKITYNFAGSRIPNDKFSLKGNGHVINLKEAKVPQKVQLELEPHSLTIQTSVVDDGTLHGMPSFYNSAQ